MMHIVMKLVPKALLVAVIALVAIWFLEVLFLYIVSNSGTSPDSKLINAIDYGIRNAGIALAGFIGYKVAKRHLLLHGVTIGILASVISISLVVIYLLFLGNSGIGALKVALTQVTLIGVLWNIALSSVGAKIAEVQTRYL